MITLGFDKSVITKAKRYANENNISLSRLIEFLLRKITSNNYNFPHIRLGKAGGRRRSDLRDKNKKNKKGSEKRIL